MTLVTLVVGNIPHKLYNFNYSNCKNEDRRSDDTNRLRG